VTETDRPVETESPVVWQRVPQGWIELVAFTDDDVAEKWWESYLAPGIDLVDPATLERMTSAFHAMRDVVRDSRYAIAGVFPYLVDEPTLFFLGTTVLPAPEKVSTARNAAAFAGLVRLGDDMRTETFVSLDGRVGSASLGTATTADGATIAAITGDVPLPGGSGTAFVIALSLDPGRLEELVPYAALALDSTRLLEPDETPPAYPPPSASEAVQPEPEA